MDFFEELGKQASKLLNNFSMTMNELSSVAATSADSAANIILLKGKLESLKVKLEKDYRDIGRAVVSGDSSKQEELVNSAKMTIAAMESMEATIEKLKREIKDKRKEAENAAIESAATVVNDTKETIQEGTEKVKNFVDDKAKDVEAEYDKVLSDVESKDGIDSE